MNFLKNLFGGGDGGGQDRRGFYVYVKPKWCEEIVEVRLDLMNELSQTDDGSALWVRKIVSAARCPFQAEITLYFDKNRNMTSSEIENGEFVTAEDYRAATSGPDSETG